MKLKNKRSGEIKEFVLFDGENELQGGATLKDLVEEWADDEKEETFWYISEQGVIKAFPDYMLDYKGVISNYKAIGNYFRTKEEAKKALEKLKAWIRLKDKGFVWQGWEEGVMDDGMCIIDCQIPENNWETDVVEYLDLLFGGEE